jgi:hypothetical protein
VACQCHHRRLVIVAASPLSNDRAERFHRRTRIVSRHGIPRGSDNSQTQNPKKYEMVGKPQKAR